MHDSKRSANALKGRNWSAVWLGQIVFCKLIFFLIMPVMPAGAQTARECFLDLQKQIPSIIVDIRYHSSDNFVGTQIDGYKNPVALLTKQAVEALKKIQTKLAKEGLGLKIFDAYRPQKGVNHFVRWAKIPTDTLTKSTYYPKIGKADVFKLGYVAGKSGHSRGSTVDVTLIDLAIGKDIDMGSSWDFFGEISWHAYNQITVVQKANRKKLKDVMAEFGFNHYYKEWWHYTLEDEPFPKTYFDFDVK